MKLIPEDIGQAFKYDPETGAITTAAGRLCKAKVTRGDYLKIKYLGKEYVQHRVAWFLYYGTQPPAQVDHRDGNGHHNWIDNLRGADNSTNQMNITATAKSSTGVKGVFPVRGGKLYRAEVCINGKRHQKHSADPLKLSEWATAMRNELHGEFARH